MNGTHDLACKETGSPRTFGAPTYFLSDGSTNVTALTANPACTVPAANRATILTTPTGYVINLATDSLKPYWRIDIPPIRIDPAVVPAGAKIAVKIELYDVTAGAGICPTCIGCICDCVIEVATVCCASGSASSTAKFPYFTDLTGASGWWNGIAINNPSAAVGTCKLTANEKNGNVATATVTVPAGGMFSSLLQDMTWAGATGGVPASITAVCDYAGVTGFAMMSDYAGSSMGYTFLP
jgi:hypothetical protein